MQMEPNTFWPAVARSMLWGLLFYMLAWVICLEIWGPYQGGTRYIEMPLAVLGPAVEGIAYAVHVVLAVIVLFLIFVLYLAACRLIGGLLAGLMR